jgi:hypothetical protein
MRPCNLLSCNFRISPLPLAIWEGPAHRQILDALEVMERKQAHRLLFELLSESASRSELHEMEARVERHLTLSREEKEAGAEALITELARFTAEKLLTQSGTDH